MIINSEDIIKAIDKREREFTVWVGGVEVTDCYVDKETAERICQSFVDDGYDDVIVEEY